MCETPLDTAVAAYLMACAVEGKTARTLLFRLGRRHFPRGGRMAGSSMADGGAGVARSRRGRSAQRRVAIGARSLWHRAPVGHG
jgi:hypothetical protein